jgi:hypothetical protein
LKVSLLAASVIMFSTASQACNLSDNDFKALAASPSHLTRSDFDALTPARLKAVCDTRTFIAYVDAQKGVIEDIMPYSTKWLTSEENARIVAASDAYVEKMIKAGKIK